MTVTKLYTIGYEKRSLDEYIAILTSAGIDVVVDVREVAWSRKRGFSKGGLSAGLAAAGIEYVHARFAGNPKRLRKPASNQAETMARYRERLAASPDILLELGRLIDRYVEAGKAVALTCYERHPGDCHRSILAEAWAERPGRSVEHLATESVRERVP